MELLNRFVVSMKGYESYTTVDDDRNTAYINKLRTKHNIFSNYKKAES